MPEPAVIAAAAGCVAARVGIISLILVVRTRRETLGARLAIGGARVRRSGSDDAPSYVLVCRLVNAGGDTARGTAPVVLIDDRWIKAAEHPLAIAGGGESAEFQFSLPPEQGAAWRTGVGPFEMRVTFVHRYGKPTRRLRY